MSDLLSFNPSRALTANGTASAAAKAYFYDAGTSTPKTVYSDAGLSIPHASPLQADAGGIFAQVFTDGEPVKVVVQNAGGSTLYTLDPAPSDSATSFGSVISFDDVTALLADTKLAYGSGVYRVAAGNIIRTQAEGFAYEVAASGASDQHVTTAGGVKLYVQPGDAGYNALAFGTDNTGATNCLSAVTAAWNASLADGVDLYFPSGTYEVSSENNFPFGRIGDTPPVSLLDCKNVTIFGDGPTTILRTDTVTGGDVIQLNGAKNLHFRNLKLTASISGTDAGSNGVSVTGGYDNLTFDHIWCENLAFLDKTTYVDGGKALSIQTPVAGQTLACGTLKASNIFAKGCVYGFGLEVDISAASTMDTTIDVDVVAEDCRQAVVVSGAEATSALSANWTMGLRVRAQAINCMADLALFRAHGVDVECQVITTKTDAARILSYTGSKWFAADTTASVEGLACAYAHKSRVKIIGNKGTCSYKARVGGAGAGSSGLTAATWQSQIDVGLAGTASVADFGAVDSGGNVTSECALMASSGTSAPASAHYLPSRNNAIVVGNAQMLSDLLVQGTVKFTHTDGLATFGGEVGFDDASVTVKQKTSSSVSTEVLKILNNAGAGVFSIRNDGAILSSGRNTASAVATVKNVLPVYDASNALVGYVPIYTSFTP